MYVTHQDFVLPRFHIRIFIRICNLAFRPRFHVVSRFSAKGEVGGASHAGSLVDFSRKTGADLALLEAKAGKPKKRRQGKGDGKPGPGASDASSGGGGGGKKRQRGSGSDSKRRGGEDGDLSDDSTGGGGGVGGLEVEIVDEFGRHRTVTRGGPEHREHLQAKKRVAEIKAEQESEQEAAALGASSSSFDDRYSYRGNRGAAPPPPSYHGRPPSLAADGSAPAGGWAWSSGAGRGADAGDFETREGQERRAKKDMTELLEREGAGEAGKGDGGAKASLLSSTFSHFVTRVTCYVVG